MESKNCTCGAGQKIYCKNCSKVQMAILLKNGNDHLKYQNARGHLCCPNWYSVMKLNRKPLNVIIEGMIRRFAQVPELVSATNMLKFYDNKTNQEIFTYRL